jgi:hypothetical protein
MPTVPYRNGLTPSPELDMTTAFATSAHGATPTPEYQPGVCNIGPAEIRRRRMAGHVGALVTAAAFIGLVAVDAPPITRLVLILPAAGAASGYIQAQLKFCAGFGSRGVFNFDSLGTWTTVTDREALARDRRRSREIAGMALAAGVVVGVVAALLPI